MTDPSLTPADSAELSASGAPASGPAQVLTRGTSLGRYVVLEVIGFGGQGVVYAAYDPQLDRKVALKLVRVRDGGDANDEQRARLLKEAQVLARLSHPNVVTVHDVGRFADQVFIAMEFMGGGTLGAWLSKKPGQAEVVQRFREAGQGLAAAHAAGIVHRDFKPDNVLLDEHGVAHVTDFGLARPLDEGSVIVGGGTAAWMSPEQRARQELSPASDQYSWCAALFRALTGEMPEAQPKFPAAVPVWIRKVLVRGLAHEPAQRFPSMKALLLAFEQDPQQARRRVVNAVLAVAALVVIGVGIGVLLGRETPAQRAERECLSTVESTLQSTWSPARLATMREAFVTSLGEPGRDAFTRVWAQLEPETRAWADAARASCQMDAASAERRSRDACLSARGAVLASLAEVFASADAQVVENAQATVTLEVQPAASCNTTEAPVAALARDTAADRELRPELGRARVLRAAGRYADGITAALEVAANAEAVKAWRVRAEAQLLAGLLSAELRRPDTESLLSSAIGLAERAGSDDERARGWISLVGFYSERERFEDAHRAAAIADDIATRLGRPDLLEAERLNQLGMLSMREGDSDTARKAFEQTLLLRRKHAPPSHPSSCARSPTTPCRCRPPRASRCCSRCSRCASRRWAPTTPRRPSPSTTLASSCWATARVRARAFTWARRSRFAS